MNERRQYFRIDDAVSLKYTVLDKDTYDNEILNINNDQHAVINMLNTLNVLDSKLLLLMESLKQENPTMAAAISILNKKVMVMGSMMSQASNDGYQVNHLEQVNLSANGIAFSTTEKLESDSLLKLELVLVPEYHYSVIYGRVLNSESNEGNNSVYRTSVEFEGINDQDKEKIIQHVMKKQSDELREQRQSKIDAA